jgi:hypothetical protein
MSRVHPVGSVTTWSMLGARGLLGTTNYGTGGPLQFRDRLFGRRGALSHARVWGKSRGMKRSTVAKFGVPAVIGAFAFGSALPAGAAPAQHFEESVVGDVFDCGDNVYTVTSGTLKSVFHEGTTPTGNTNFTGTLTPKHVVLEDEAGNQYRLSGAVWFGETSNAQQGSLQGTFTAYLNILSQGGGVVDRVAVTAHFNDGNEFEFDKGTCVLPE